MKKLMDSLNWRYATKKYDSTKKLTKKELNDLLEVLRLAPSSYGLQPWKFVVVENKDLRKSIQQAAWNQSQVSEASHLVVLCTRTDLDENYVKKYVDFMSQESGAPRDKLAAVENMMLGFRKGLTSEQVVEWGKKQVYLACGFLLMAAGLKKIDASPMEGFDPVKVDEILGLKEMHLTSTVIVALGHRSAEDKYASAKKVRFSKEDVVVVNK
jgi:nitroreductase / dihydropteridine reductase